MPVIGRLDEQVNEVLITPLERGRDRQPPDAPGGDARTPPPPPPEPTEHAPGDETSRAPVELPVWLL